MSFIIYLPFIMSEEANRREVSAHQSTSQTKLPKDQIIMIEFVIALQMANECIYSALLQMALQLPYIHPFIHDSGSDHARKQPTGQELFEYVALGNLDRPGIEPATCSCCQTPSYLSPPELLPPHHSTLQKRCGCAGHLNGGPTFRGLRVV